MTEQNIMNFKMEYISKLFGKISKKHLELYVITRIWHRLNNTNVKMIPQQYVKRSGEKYALTDIFFPQVGIFVEVNEPAHYTSKQQIHLDSKRKKEIEKVTDSKVFDVNCTLSMKEINKRVDDIVKEIKDKIKVQGKSFKKWNPEEEYNPDFWKKKKVINIIDEISLNTIESICILFSIDPNKAKRGFLRVGGVIHPKNKNVLVWWPSEQKRSGKWMNTLSKNDKKIIEKNNDPKETIIHINKLNEKEEIRYVFFHYKDILGFTDYKFKGIFQYSKKKSNYDLGAIWERIGTEINLESNSYS